jgi:septal ring factor EnvC (AmiA/AmiB activator)
MNIARCAVLAVVLSALSGCVLVRNPEPEPAGLPPPHPYAGVELDELLRYAGRVAALPAAARQAECRKVLKLYETDRGPGVRLHLLLAQSVTDACGDLKSTLALTEAALAEAADERLKALLVYQREILTRIKRGNDEQKALRRQISQALSKEQKVHRRLKSQQSELKSQQSELKVLQKKLDALKAIEQSLEEPDERP